MEVFLKDLRFACAHGKVATVHRHSHSNLASESELIHDLQRCERLSAVPLPIATRAPGRAHRNLSATARISLPIQLPGLEAAKPLV